MSDADTLLGRSPTRDNSCFLAPQFLRDIESRYGGTRLGRQELEAEIIDDDPDALFSRAQIETNRARSAPELVRIVVAIDPPASGRAGANACGIVCAGLGGDGKAYVLDDATAQRASPATWAKRAIALYHARQADRLIAEVNQGGDMVEAVIREIDPAVSFKAVHASRGKRLRAEPVAALYEQNRVVHVGVFPELEDELVSFDQKAVRPASPDRADALVWALSELMLVRRREPRMRVL
jgi:predicted phage terminase large subunit-like protein